MDSEEKKLIDEIRDGLYNFEIPYEEGNWENFQKLYGRELNGSQRKQRKIPIVLWKYISSAAVLTGILVYVQWTRLEEGGGKDDRTAELAKETTKDTGVSLSPTDGNDILSVSFPENHPVAQTVKPGLVTVHASSQAPKFAVEEDLPPNHELKGKIVTANPPVPPTANKDKSASAIGHPEEHERTFDRWKFGIELNSSLTTGKANIAAGILTRFKISEKLKLSTGLIYSRISATHDTDPMQRSYGTRMIGGESMIKAIDIPLAVVYEPTDGWYASVGVSALAVLDEDKVYRMETEVLQEKMTVDPESGASVSVFNVVRDEYNERSMDTDFEGQSNLRYLNLSIGRKQRLNNNMDLLFEPFVKIPMGGLQRHDINLLTSGIKVKVLF